MSSILGHSLAGMSVWALARRCPALKPLERREAQHRRTILWVFLLEVAILAIMVAVALGAWVEQRNLLERVEAQNEAQLLGIEENRQAASTPTALCE